MSSSSVASPVAAKITGSSSKKPFFGLTGNALNAWVNVACITAMTLFGALLLAIF